MIVLTLGSKINLLKRKFALPFV